MPKFLFLRINTFEMYDLLRKKRHDNVEVCYIDTNNRLLRDSKIIQTYNNLVCKRTLNYLTSLAK